MGGGTCLTFEPGGRPPAELKADLLESIDRVDGSQVGETDDGRVFVVVPSGNFGLPVATPCDRAVWQNDTTMMGGGTLYEWTGDGFETVEERWDEEYGRESYEYFKREYGFEARAPKRTFD